MALMHQATMTPTKLELLSAWVPTRPWYRGPDAAAVTRVAAARFDDPAGEVGIETILLRCGDGPVLHVPLTYRGAPLAGADQWLVGTSEHSVLGLRWVYDACGDPVYAAVLATTVLTGGEQAEEFLEVDGQPVPREAGMSLRGTGQPGVELPAVTAVVRVDDGDPTVVVTDTVTLSIVRTPAEASDPVAGLKAWWPGHETPVLLATVTA
jgi:hypothetical protein